MPKQTYILNDFSGGINNIKDSRDIADNQCAKIVNLMVDKQGAIRTAGSFTAYPDSGDTQNLSGDSSDNQKGNGLFYFESDYGTLATTDTTTDNGSGAFGTFYNPPDNQFSQRDSDVYAAFDIGDKISISGSDNNDGIYTIISKVDTGLGSHARYRFGFLEDTSASDEVTDSAITIKSHSQYGAKFWMKPRDSNGSTAANLEISVWDSESESWSHSADIIPMGSDNYIQGTFQPVYYAIDNAVRMSDSNFVNGSKVRWFGYIERGHPDQFYHGWFTKDNDLLAPTAGDDVRIGSGATYPDTAGVGLHWLILSPSDTSSTWVADTYETAMTFIYDENQESKITEMQSSYVNFTVAAGDSVTIKAEMFTPYNPRISGARLYCRISGSDDEWILLAEAHFTKGIKATLDADFTAGWTVASTNQYYSSTVTSLAQNLDTYETINGRSSSVKSIALGKIGELWKCAVVCNRRVFLANVKTQDEGTTVSDSKHYGDRILYSDVGKFDTFPSHNFIDVVKGDSEEYVALAEYGDRLLAFKHKTLFVINVASPEPTGWFLEKTFKHNGVRHKESVFRSEDGVVWVNASGCWFYNGSNIANLVENKLDTVNSIQVDSGTTTGTTSNKLVQSGQNFTTTVGVNDVVINTTDTTTALVTAIDSATTLSLSADIMASGENYVIRKSEHALTWKDFYDVDTIVGYSPKYKQIIVLQDCSGGTNPMNTLIYDFRTKGWVQNSDQSTFFNNVVYSNFVLDGDGELAIMTTGGVIRYYTPISSASTTGAELVTKFIDFGDPYGLKKVYKVGLSYKSSAAQVDPLEIRYIDASGDMQSFADIDGSVNFANKTDWNVAVFTAATPVTCQSLQLRLNPPSAGTVDINEIMVNYRPIHKKVA